MGNKKQQLANRSRRRFKLSTKGKCYSHKDSPLFRLRSKRKFSNLVGTPLSDLFELTNDCHYFVFNEQKSGKKREVQQPDCRLDRVHSRIASLLCRIKTPEYLHSGVKGRTHITNANQHSSLDKFLVTDIKSFYQSTKFPMVYNFFNRHMECSPDISWLLASMSTYGGSIPTGSRLSMVLAFWVNSQMFEKLNRLSEKENVKMTLYVDDLTFSGDSINRLFAHQVKRIVSSFGHLCHPKKTKIYKKDQAKIVTGVALTENGISVSNKQHRSIYQDFVLWEATKRKEIPGSLCNRLLGKLNSQGQIDPRFSDRAMSLRSEIRKRKRILPVLNI